jgi:hypothetical protein
VTEHERKMQALDITVTILLFIVGCIVGKLVMSHISNTWLDFNGPAIGILAIGELIWWRVRKRIIKKWEED